MEKIKNYFLWPVLGLFSFVTVFLFLSLILSKIISFIPPEKEEILWNVIKKDYFFDQSYNQIKVNLEAKINILPNDMLPSLYNKLEVLIVNDSSINAFSAPGGKIILTTGLLGITNQDEEILLFVLGHEIAHLKRRDHLYEFSRMTIAKIYAKVTSLKFIEDLLLLFDSYRQKEIEFMADKFALRVLNEVYGRTRGGEVFFNILAQIDNKSSSTHPTIKQRIERVAKYNEN